MELGEGNKEQDFGMAKSAVQEELEMKYKVVCEHTGVA